MSDPNSTEFFDREIPEGESVVSPFSSGFVLSGKFKLEKQLGRGGMGEAWKAFDTLAERAVVLKFVPKEIQHVKEAMDSVKDSFKKVHALQHQHICPVYDLFQDEQHGLCLVMKFIDGMPLDEYRRKLIEKNKNLSFSDLVQILWGVAQGLDYAHEKKVVHRDIKPQNIMVGKTDGVQIIDFGLAEEIRSSMVRFSEVTMGIAGTRPYMAPEQWQGKYQDAKTDQYALAVTAYELFSGRVPFQGSDVGILRECVLHDAPDPIPNLPDYINNALLKALSKKREDRFENCKTFIRAMSTKPKKQITVLPEAENIVPSLPTINLKSEKQGGDENDWKPPQISTGSVAKSGRRNPIPFFASISVASLAVILGLVFAFSGKDGSKPNATDAAAHGKQQATPAPVSVEPPQDMSVLSDAEKRELQQKYPEFDWTGANVVVLTKPNEDELRNALEKAGETPENDFIIVRTTKEKHRIVLKGGSFEFVVNAKEKGAVTLIGLGPEKLVLDANGKDRIFDILHGAETGFGDILFTNGFIGDKRGGAISVYNDSKSTIIHCDFIDNACIPGKSGVWWEGFGGGAIFCDKNSSIVLRDIRFEGNRNNAPEAFFQSRPEGLRHCHDSSGGLLLAGNSSLVATHVVFRKNLGGAMFIQEAKAVDLHNIALIDNRSCGAAAIHLHGNDSEQTYRIANLFATGNSGSEFGGALHIGGKGRIVLDHLTLIGNSAQHGGGLCFGGGGDYNIDAKEVMLSNSLIAGNNGLQVKDFSRNDGKVKKYVFYNNITSEWNTYHSVPFVEGQNNRFMELAEIKLGELRDFGNGLPVMPLLEGSPAIDAGVVTENMPKTDITGRPRNFGKAPDIGAFEWTGKQTPP